MSRRRDWSALAGCLAVVAAIAVGVGDREEGVPMGYADVAVGETGASSTFAARVLDVQVGRQVQKDEYSEPLVTDAMFVVVEVAADAFTEAVSFSGDVWLVTTTGHRYEPRPEANLGHPPFTPPGFTGTGTFVFQVPPDRLDGARLLLEPPTGTFITYDVTVRVDLDLTEDTTPVATPIELGEPSLAVTP